MTVDLRNSKNASDLTSMKIKGKMVITDFRFFTVHKGKCKLLEKKSNYVIQNVGEKNFFGVVFGSWAGMIGFVFHIHSYYRDWMKYSICFN